MRTTTVGETAKDIFHFLSSALKRFWMMYRNGGYEDDWAFARVSGDVTDINTKMPDHRPRHAEGHRWQVGLPPDDRI